MKKVGDEDGEKSRGFSRERRTWRQKEGLHHGWLGTRVPWLRAFECVFQFSLKENRTLQKGPLPLYPYRTLYRVPCIYSPKVLETKIKNTFKSS